MIKPGTLIYINAGGLVGSKRPVRDGIAYFGTEAGRVQHNHNNNRSIERVHNKRLRGAAGGTWLRQTALPH